MKRCIFTKVKFMALFLFAALMAACTTDVYEPKPDPAPGPKPEPVVPNEGDANKYTNSNSVTLNVNVADKYAGQYVYTVEVFNGDPILDPNAKLITGSGQKTNEKIPYNATFVVPADLKVVYVCVSDPFKNKRFYTMAVSNNMTLDLSTVETKVATSLRAAGNANLPTDFDWNYADAETLMDGSVFDSFNLSSGLKKFYVPKGTTISISRWTNWGGSVRLYIEGTVNISNDLTINYNQSGFVVLEGGSLVADKQLTFQSGKSELLVADGGFVQCSTLFLNDINARVYNGGDMKVLEMKVSNASKLYNLKDLRVVSNIDFSSSSYLYNGGSISAPQCSSASSVTLDNYGVVDYTELVLNSQTTLNNYGKFTVGKLTHGGTPVINNNCAFYINESAVFNGFNINLGESSYMHIKKATGRGLDLKMGESAMFDVDNMTQENDFVVQGPTSGNALLNIKSLRIGGTTKLSNIVAAYWNQVDNYSGWNAIILDGVDTASGQSDFYIPKGDCNEIGNGGQPVGPVIPDTGEDYEEAATLSYTYMFEDNWPAQGDYDMNDLVINVQIMNKKSGNKVTGFKTKCILYATGGTKELDVAFQLVDVPANKLSGAESGQTYAVAELFKDAHTQLGSAERKPVNTYSITKEPAVFEKSYAFSSSLEQPVTAGNLNLFIVWGGIDSNPRNEVHLPGFGGTDKAAAGSYLSDDKWMWAIAVPTDDFASYPKESVRIDDAYAGFSSWILGGDVPGWYKVTDENEGKVISWK